jgi:hypothetical protein
MNRIPLTNANIGQLLKPFLSGNAHNDVDSNKSSNRTNEVTASVVLDSLLVDFGCKYRIIVKRNEKLPSYTILIHIGIIGWETVETHCIQKLKRIFGASSVFSRNKHLHEENDSINPAVKAAVVNGYDLCIQVRTDALPVDQDAHSVENLLSNIRLLVLGSQLKDSFMGLLEKNDGAKEISSTTFKIPLQRRFSFSSDCKQSQQYIIVSCQSDRVTTVTPFVYSNEIDCAIARLFLQQFEQAQRKSMNERHGKNVPICDYRRSTEPPREVGLEITDAREKAAIGSGNVSNDIKHHAGYMSFTFLEDHIAEESKQSNAISNVLMLMDFVDYHIKCSKSNMNSRMRSKKETLLRCLFNE